MAPFRAELRICYLNARKAHSDRHIRPLLHLQVSACSMPRVGIRLGLEFEKIFSGNGLSDRGQNRVGARSGVVFTL